MRLKSYISLHAVCVFGFVLVFVNITSSLIPQPSDFSLLTSFPPSSFFPHPSDLILQPSDFEDISEKVSWQSKNGSLKDVDTADEKLDMIQSWGLTFADGLDLNGKTILLVDDLYHSGVTMQYIAMKMKEAGAKRVFGMALVKSLGN